MSDQPTPDCRYRLALLDALEQRLITEWFGENERAKALATFRVKERVLVTAGYSDEVFGIKLEDMWAQSTIAVRFLITGGT